MITPRIDLQFEIEPIAPETAATLTSRVRASVDEAIVESAIGANLAHKDITFERHLPLTPDQIEMLKIGVQFLLAHGPKMWEKGGELARGVLRKLAGGRGSRVSGKIELDGTIVEFKALKMEAAIVFVPQAMEALAETARQEG